MQQTPHDGPETLRLLYYNIQEAKATLKDWAAGQRPWNEVPVDVDAFAPLLPANVSFHLSISEAAVLLNVRMLEAADPNTGTNTPMSFTSGTATPSYTGLSLRDRLATALGGGRPAFHDEAHEMVMYRGQGVRVRDKVRVDSQDPSLMAAMAKLGALERNIALSRRALDIVMGKENEEG
ncbi:hypothetical protein LTR53_011013 [Teratosphaeriaceae sp. CCFEE 6253]|nr:hypothetical protein LTR53_011013 [Teratosphaeriaceae sp. CCFEE 6253]